MNVSNLTAVCGPKFEWKALRLNAEFAFIPYQDISMEKRRNCFIALSPRNYCARRSVNTSMRFEQRRRRAVLSFQNVRLKKRPLRNGKKILLVRKKLTFFPSLAS